MFKSILRQIANTLYVNAQFIDQYGLLTGKLGIVLFFYRYSRFTGNSIYSEFADEYIDNLFGNITSNHEKDFAEGLSGIGWGIEYLIRNNFVEADNDILDEMDAEIGKMTIEDFVTELNNDIPLFSKGLYFLSRENRGVILETLAQCKEFLITSSKTEQIIPMSYLNSIIYFLNKVKEMNIGSNSCNQVLKEVFIYISNRINHFSDLDLLIFKHNIKTMDDHDEWHKLIENYKSDYKPDILEQGWINLIYQYESGNDSELASIDLQGILINQLQNPDTSDLAIYRGIAGVGLALLAPQMEDKVSVTYYQTSTDVLYLSSFIMNHGASIAAYRIHSGLRKIGLHSKMLVLESGLSSRENSSEEIYVVSPEEDEQYGYYHEMKPTNVYPQYVIASNSFAPGTAGVHIDRYIDEFDPKIIQLHFINAGFINIEEIGKIRKKIVWRLPDCWAFTGGCYYFGDCNRYITGCGKCPKLGSNDENDLSSEIWKRKEKAWSMIDMTIVVPTLWMKEKVLSSTLLKDRDVYVIPNGINLEEFYPITKTTARQELSIPSDKKIILFGATRAMNDPRKGFALLLKALQFLSEMHKNEYFFLVFGAEYQTLDLNIPTKFMGQIQENKTLRLAYSAADVMVVPSLEEAFGQTVIEAMACETPVVSFRKTGPESIIDHKETGYLARYADVADLAHGIEWTLSSDELNDYLSKNARCKVATTYDITLVAQQYKELYHKLKSQIVN
ncbi:glycosyltransferase [Bacteroides sp. 519]|uniref:glycosyltransferase n=1 Tax=Bacteroides sp. 519 TaxID=2302937 RepID=UPI0013D53ACA|nr:glycosyltransferase [Bacteroides sp. 519]